MYHSNLLPASPLVLVVTRLALVVVEASTTTTTKCVASVPVTAVMQILVEAH